MNTGRTQFKKGHSGYWTGKNRPSPSAKTRAQISIGLTGKKQSGETIQKRVAKLRGKKRTLEQRIRFSGENNPSWKGDKVGYGALHDWVTSRLGRPHFCAYCGTNKAKKFEWANISRTYRRELSDFIRLCTRCHHLFDRGEINLGL